MFLQVFSVILAVGTLIFFLSKSILLHTTNEIKYEFFFVTVYFIEKIY